ncbi:LOW QUALITY PROTEIN: hypothetical protein JCM24511_02044 [Saitozyma sp. JCM 24511]|nr:LOW QUALITY PROTEIN: hypothetical protein JCM24511_02044 [Saitozyma sp. JCM 24511]
MQVLNDRGPTVFVVTLVIIIVATVFIVLRLISKWGVSRRANADDYVVLVGWVFAVGLSVSIMIGTRVGLGAPDSGEQFTPRATHAQDTTEPVEIKPEWFTPLKKCTYAFTVLYNPSIMATKTAVLLLYYRIAAAHLFLRYASLFVMAVINIAGIVLTFIYIFQCRPIDAAFSMVDGTCIDIIALYLSSMPINVLTDLAILLLPLPILTSLRMEHREKVILVATFIVGGFATVVDVVRIVYLQEALREELLVDPSAAITATSRPPNFTYYASFSLMWSVVEVSVGIMCCCVLVLKPLVMRVMPKLLHDPQIRRHSRLFSDTSKYRYPRLWFNDLNNLDDVPSPPSITLSATAPLSPRGAELSLSESPVSPLPLRRPILPATPERSGSVDGEGETLDFFEMLANESTSPTPSDPLPPRLQTSTDRTSTLRRSTIGSNGLNTLTTQEPTQTFFDFVQVKSRVPLTQLTAKEAWWPILFVSTLDFLWGFANGLIGGLSLQIQMLLGYPPSHSLALNNAFYCAYFFGPLLVGYWVLKLVGFKATFMTGLAIYATGALSFWPSSVLRSYPGFFVSNFIIALGLSCLEVSANLFIVLAGPGQLSEARLLFAQGFYGIGNIVSPIIALTSGIDQGFLFRVQWCYLAVALFVILLALIFYYVPLSEAGDEHLESMALERFHNAGLDQGAKAFGVDPRQLVLWSGVLLVFFFESIDAVVYFWPFLFQEIRSGPEPFWDLTIGRSGLTFGRFLAAWLCFVGIPPRILLGICVLGTFLSSLLAFVVPRNTHALVLLVLINFFIAPSYPITFAMTMRGQGKHTKFAAAALVMTIASGSVWLSVVDGIQLRYPTDSLWSLLLLAIVDGISLLWPVMVSSNRVLRRWVDPKWSKHSRNEEAFNLHLDATPAPSMREMGQPEG